MEDGGCSCQRQWWVGQIKLPEFLRAVATTWVYGGWGRQRDGGLWRRHTRLTVCAASWLIVDSNQYSVLSPSLWLSVSLDFLSHFFFFFFNLSELVSRVKVLMGLKKIKIWVRLWGGQSGLCWGGLVRVGWA